MSDRINLQRRVSELNKSPQFDSYSKVIIHIDDETDITVGDDYGRTFEITNPFGTRQMAIDLLAKLRGFQYQPFTASGALLDPAAEIGDGIAVKDVYGGMYTRVRTFNRLMKADISAPHDEEINHEYQFETPQERRVRRQFGDVRATFAIQAGLIEARVSKTSPTGQTSFSWALNDTSHKWYANGNEVMSVSASGLTVKGRIEASSGYIGNGTSGFTISARALYNGMTSLGDTTHNGVYIGVDGISLGKGNFKVDSYGNLTAKSGTFSGSVRAGSILYGGSNGTFNAAGLTDSSIGSAKYGSGSVGGGAIANSAISNGKIANSAVSYGKVDFPETLDQVGTNKSNIESLQAYFRGGAAATRMQIATLQLLLAGEYCTISGKTIKDGNGNYVAVLTF